VWEHPDLAPRRRGWTFDEFQTYIENDDVVMLHAAMIWRCTEANSVTMTREELMARVVEQHKNGKRMF
jgi:hypothetical protein